MSKVLLVGLDGATFDIIHQLIDQGRLPTLARIMEDGAWGPLQSTIPPITPTAWTSVFTGKNPGKHGIYDFREFDPRTYEKHPVQIDRHREQTVWDLLGQAGKRSIIVDVPYTHPPRPVDGLMITGYGTPRTADTVFTYPETLADEVPDELRSEIRLALPNHRFDRSQSLIDEWTEIMRGRRRLLRHLITEEDWDFFFTVFTITDNLAHIFWTFVEPQHPNYDHPDAPRFREAFFNAYEQCDALLGDLIGWAGDDTTTLVMSDHGFGSVYPRQYLFSRLAEGGYIRYQSPPLFSVFGDRLLKLAMRTYTKLPFLREWIKNLRPGQQKAVKKALDRGGLLPTQDAIEYRRSRVLPTNFGLQLWVNEQGAFAEGIVPPDEKEDLLADLSRHLQSDVAPGGESIIAAVHRGKEIYEGPKAALGPDAVIEYRNFYRSGRTSAAQNPHLEGGHTGEGIFLASGKNIRHTNVEGATLLDLAPTVLHLSKQAVPPDVDGRVLTELLTDEYNNENPVRKGTRPARDDEEPIGESGYTPEEEAEIERQLRQLGYI